MLGIMIRTLALSGAILLAACAGNSLDEGKSGASFLIKHMPDQVPRKQEYIQHVTNTYSGKGYRSGSIAALTLIQAELEKSALDIAISKLKSDSPSSTLDGIKAVFHAVSLHTEFISDQWREAIRADNIRTTPLAATTLPFSEAIRIIVNESKYAGLNEKLDEAMSLIASKVKSLDKSKYPQTYEAYAILATMAKKATDPDGSLINYNAEISSIKREFEKTLSLAELEY